MLQSRLTEIRDKAARALGRLKLRQARWAAESLFDTAPRHPCTRLAYDPMTGRTLPFTDHRRRATDIVRIDGRYYADNRTAEAELPEWAQKALHSKAFNIAQFPEVTPAEHDWLLKHGLNKIASLTRLHGEEGWLNTDPMTQAKKPVVREIWLKARSLNCTTEGDLPEGLQASQDMVEDQAELTDMQSYLYDDPVAFDKFIDRETLKSMRKRGLSAKNKLVRTTIARSIARQYDSTSFIHDPETGEYRPAVASDVIQVVHGSNEDLDALFLEEADDPRVQNDIPGAETTDHTWSGRFRANTYVEDQFLQNSCVKNPKELAEAADGTVYWTNATRLTYSLPNSAPNMADIRWKPDELTIHRLAQAMVSRFLEKHPEEECNLTDWLAKAATKLTGMAKNFNSEEDTGFFITKDEFFGTIESNLMQLERSLTRTVPKRYEQVGINEQTGKPIYRTVSLTREPPRSTDWDTIAIADGRPEILRKRKLEQFRNRLKAQLVPPQVPQTNRHR